MIFFLLAFEATAFVDLGIVFNFCLSAPPGGTFQLSTVTDLAFKHYAYVGLICFIDSGRIG